MIAGTSSILEIAFFSAIFTVVIGTVLGIVSGFVGGWVDKIIMGITNIFFVYTVFPRIFAACCHNHNRHPHIARNGYIYMELGGTLPRYSRTGYEFERTRLHSNMRCYARMSKAHVIFKELLPNVFSYIVINFVMAMRNAIMASVGIMLVGLAAYDPTNWGAIINAARTKGLINPQNVAILMYPLVAPLYSSRLC